MIISSPLSRCCCGSSSTITTTALVSYIVESVADLRALDSSVFQDNELAQTLGYYTPGDGGSNIFYWDDNDSDTDNGGTVIKPTDVGSGLGRWRILP